MNTHWLTREERSSFENEGYLVVRDALSAEQAGALSAAVDRCGRDEARGFYNRPDILGLDDAFVELVDNPPVLAKIAGLLGWNIRVNHTHFNVRPPDDSSAEYPYYWHRDGGLVGTDLQDQMPMMAIKVGFYLTDMRQPDHGQTYILPLSCPRERELARDLSPHDPPPPDAVPLNVPAGAAVLFQQRVLHSQGSPNLSPVTRKAIFVQWAFRWLYPVDTMTVGDLRARVTDPVRRQMLGFDQERPPGKLSAHYYPSSDDIPLRKRLLREVGMARLCEIGPATARTITRLLKFDT